MKTRMLAIAFERVSESWRVAHACGFVSRMTVSRDGARSAGD